MKPLLLVAAGGALGAIGRHLVGMGALRLWGAHYPFGTLAANVMGGLAMGFLAGWLAFAVDGGRDERLLLGVGLLGGFTTFSAFALEVVLMIDRRAYGTAATYALLSVTGACLALFVGLAIARRIFA